MADRPLTEAERLKNKKDADKAGANVEGAVSTKQMTPGDADSPDLAAASAKNAAAEKANAVAAKVAKVAPDPDAPDPNDSAIIAASKKRRRDAAAKAKAEGQKGAMKK
jgi:hypothetical protein